MKVDFMYSEIKGFEVKDKNFLGVFKPKIIEGNFDLKEMLINSLQDPIAVNSLNKQLKKESKVLIICDDNTRSTPVNEILQVLLPYLENKIKKTNIEILVALGTHRKMDRGELVERFGPKIVNNYKITNHNWQDKKQNIFYGETTEGIEVWGNKLAKESDFVIGIGHIVPHRVAGFSGGGKIMQPGISTAATTDQTHWLSAQVRGSEILGVRENIVREQIDQSAELMGLDFIINVVQDLKGKVVGVFSGDFKEAHKKGCKLAKKVYSVEVPKADIVIVDSYPADIELWQAAKGIYSSELVVKDEGIVIMATPCYEGVSKTHPEIKKFGYHNLNEVKNIVNSNKMKNLCVAAHLVHVGEVICDKAKGYLVSPYLSNKTINNLNFIAKNSVQEALDEAIKIKGEEATIVTLLHAGEILPYQKK